MATYKYGDFVKVQKLDPFDPSCQNPVRFFNSFEKIATAIGYPNDKAKIDNFKYFLNDSSTQWFNSKIYPKTVSGAPTTTSGSTTTSTATITTLSDLKQAFLDHYLPDKAVAYNQLRLRRQGPKEPIETFITDILQLCDAANAAMDEPTKITMIRLALQPDYTRALSLISLPKTVDDLKDVLLNIERSRFQNDSTFTTGIHSFSTHNNPRSNNQRRNQQSNQYVSKNSTPGGIQASTYREPRPEVKNSLMKNKSPSCYICQSSQHWSWDCPQFLKFKNQTQSENSKGGSARGPQSNQQYNRQNNRRSFNRRPNDNRRPRQNNPPYNSSTQHINALDIETPTSDAQASLIASQAKFPPLGYTQLMSA